MGISAPRRIGFSVWRRIFFLSVRFRNPFRLHDGVRCARVNALRVKSRSYYKESGQNGC